MPNGYINLIHYDDAARVVVAALLSPKSVRREGKLYLVSDGTPITRKDICLATIQCPGLLTNSIYLLAFFSIKDRCTLVGFFYKHIIKA